MIKLTPEEALAKIKECAKEGRIKFASQDKFEGNTELLHDFMEHILNCTGYWLSNFSSIDEWEFGTKALKKYRKKILDRYGVDVPVGRKGSYYICDIVSQITDKIQLL